MTPAPPAAPGRPGALAALALLAALTLLALLPAVGSDAVFYFRDISQNHHPYRHLTVETIRGGEIPLWNPYRGAGQPLLANPNTLVLHPTTLLFLILPLNTAIEASFALQILLAGFATWLLLRDLGAGPAGRLVGAAAFAFSGYMMSLGNLLNLLNTAAFMPLTLWLAGRAVRRGFAPWGALAAFSLAVQMLAGEPAVLLCTGIGFVALSWSHPGDGARSTLAAPAARAAGIVLLAGAIGMVGILPTLELLARSERGAGFDDAEALKWSLPPGAIPEIAFPSFFGDPTRVGPANHWGGGIHDAGLPLILSRHIGGAVLLLAAIGVAAGVRRRGPGRREALVLASVGLIGLVLSLGRFLPLYPWLLDVLGPMETVRYPVKYFLLVTWAASLLAARGGDAALQSENRGPARWAAAATIALLVAGAAWALMAPVTWLRIPDALATPRTLAAIRSGMQIACLVGLIPAAACFALLGLGQGRARRAARIGLVAIPVASLVLPAMSVNPVAPRSFYEETPAIDALLGGSDPTHRVWSVPRPAGFAYRTPFEWDSDSLRWGFRWDRMTLRHATYFTTGRRFAFDRGNERLDVVPGAMIGRRLYENAARLTPEAARLLALASVDRVITYGDAAVEGLREEARLEGESNIPVVVLRNESALPRAFIVHQVETQPDPARAIARMLDPSIDPARVAVIDEGPLPAATVVPASTAARARARIVEESANRVLVAASLGAPGYLVLCDTWYPGWIARVDGVEVPIRRANGLYRAVALDPGSHEVEFRFRPASFSSGLWVSLGALILAGILGRPRRM